MVLASIVVFENLLVFDIPILEIEHRESNAPLQTMISCSSWNDLEAVHCTGSGCRSFFLLDYLEIDIQGRFFTGPTPKSSKDGASPAPKKKTN